MKIRLDLSAVPLTASGRVISGLLLPFGEVGYPHGARRLIASAGTLLSPLDPSLVELNREHDQVARVGHGIEFTEQPDGIHARYLIDETAEGDKALAEIDTKEITGLSIEIDGAVIDSDGNLAAGIITGTGLVRRPAFHSSRITANKTERSEMTPEEIEALKTALKAEILADIEKAGDDATAAEVAADVTETIEDVVEEETPPAIAAARRAAQTRRTGGARKVTARDLYKAMAGAINGPRSLIHAALADIVPANTLGLTQPAYIGELWSGKAYERQIIPAFNHADLTAMKVQGWRWKTKPGVGTWEGNKTDIPSSAILTESVEIAVQRIAGGHDIDRIYRDFSEAEFWEAYYKAMTESFAKTSDTTALATVKDAARRVTLGSVPNGVAKGIVAVVDGTMSVLAQTNTMPDHAFIAPALYRDMVLTRMEDSLAYLTAALGLEDGTMSQFRMVPRADLAAGEVLVTAKDAATVHELGGEAPIRVEALDIGKGGIDAAVYGYMATNVHNKDGLALVTVAP